MRQRIFLLLSTLALLIAGASCQELPSPPLVAPGGFKTEDIANLDAIPLEYGKLVGITSLPDVPFTAGLWFEKEDKTIVFVRVNIALGKVHEKALILPRR